MSGALFDVGGTAAGLVVRASLLMAIAWLVVGALRNASAGKRSLAWLLCMAGLLALPLLYGLLPALDVPILPPASRIATAPLPELARLAFVPEQAPLNWSAMALGVYLLGAGLLLLRFLAARQGLAALWRKSEPAYDPAWLALVEDLSAGLQLSRKIRLRIAARPVMPMTWGSLAPKLLLPVEAHSWPMERRRHVLLHELAHVSRFDSLGRSIASIACALYWFHPGAWLAARQLRLEQELAADSMVLAAAEPVAAYAGSLLDLARELGSGARHPVAATMAGKWQLERRIMAMANPTSRDVTGQGTFGVCAAATLATLASALISPVRPLPGIEAPFRRPAPNIGSGEVQATAAAPQAWSARQRQPSAVATGPANAPIHAAPRAPEAAIPEATSTGSPTPEELAAMPEAPAQPAPLQAPTPASYGPRLEPAALQQARDQQWRLNQRPAQSPNPGDAPRSNSAANDSRSAAAAAQDAPARPAGADARGSDRRKRPLRFALRIVPGLPGASPGQSRTQAEARTTMLPWPVGTQL